MKRFLFVFIYGAFVLSAFAQPGNALTAKDYEHAEDFLGYNAQKYVDHGTFAANWLPGDRFWYRTLTAQGSEFILVDPSKKNRGAAFDQQKLAAALSSANGKNYTAWMLPFQSFSFSPDGMSITFRADNKQWKCDLQNYTCIRDTSQAGNTQRQGGGGNNFRGGGRRAEVMSPDCSKAAFIKDYNLWVRDTKTDEQKQLTTDGIKDFGYATDNAGWTSSDRPTLRWSPDSKKIATFKQDQRNVGDMYLASTNVGHPTLRSWKYPLPGDKEIPMITRVVINVDEPKVIFFNIPPDPHRASLSDNISSSGTFDDID